MKKKRYMIWLLTAGLLAAGNLYAGGFRALAQEEDLLIEDTGEEFIIHSGEDLEELKAAEQAQTEPVTEPVIQEETLVLEPASSDSLEGFLTELTREESPTGSDGELNIGAYIRETMEGYGYTVSEQNFHEGFLNENGVDAPGVNIIAERGANAQTRYQDILIISTHYDSKTSPQEGDPLANDKSGAAVLLETARILAGLETDTDICFLFFSGEEDGLYGSLRFTESLEEEYRSRIVGQIHIEQAGYGENAPWVLLTADGEENLLGNLLRQEGLTEEEQAESEIQEEGSLAETEASGERNSWEYRQDDATSIRHLAQAGIRAVTVIQDTELSELEADAVPRTEKLQEITDILAMTAGKIMSPASGSLLG